MSSPPATEAAAADEQPPQHHDALPYVDFHYSDRALQHEVDRLITEEMARSVVTPQELLDAVGLPPAPELAFTDSVFLRTELERIRSGTEQVKFDASRYQVRAPTGADADSLEAWQSAVARAETQLQYQMVQQCNLELLKKYGANAWKQHAEHLSSRQTAYNALLDAKKAEIATVNRKRKADQTAVAPTLDELSAQWYTLVAKNNAVEAANAELVTKVKKLKKVVKARGLSIDDIDESGAMRM